MADRKAGRMSYRPFSPKLRLQGTGESSCFSESKIALRLPLKLMHIKCLVSVGYEVGPEDASARLFSKSADDWDLLLINEPWLKILPERSFKNRAWRTNRETTRPLRSRRADLHD